MGIRRWACAGIVAATLGLAGPVWSQTYVGVPPPDVGASDAVETEVRPSVPAPAVRSGRLAVTGADILQLVAFGALGVSSGTLIVHVSRGRALRPA